MAQSKHTHNLHASYVRTNTQESSESIMGDTYAYQNPSFQDIEDLINYDA